MNYKQLMNKKPERNLTNYVIHYEEIGVAVERQHTHLKWDKQRIEKWGIAASNGVLLAFVLLAHAIIK